MIEKPVFFSSGGEALFGILTTPGPECDALVLIAGPGSANAATFQRNCVAVELARRLAESGLAVLRFDYHGIGDSTGDLGNFDLEKPLREDMDAAVMWARTNGFTRLGLVGICYGTRTALSVMDSDENVSAIALVTMPFAEKVTVLTRKIGFIGLIKGVLRPSTWRRFSDPAHRIAYRKLMLSGFRRLTGRRADRASRSGRRANAMSRLLLASASRIPILMLYGIEDRHYLNAREAIDSLAAKVPGLTLDTSYLGELHGFPTLQGQKAFVDKLVDWLPTSMAVSAGHGNVFQATTQG
jgi:pimeloyl-ACP methyl ester carboxylesterase